MSSVWEPWSDVNHHEDGIFNYNFLLLVVKDE